VSLHERFGGRGLSILAFPSHEFGGQEFREEGDIRSFVDKYGVRFPMFAPVTVNGAGAHPLFAWLTQGTPIRWNFDGKFLVGREGQLLARFGSRTPPEALAKAVEEALASP